MAPSRSTDPPAPPAPEPGRLDSWKEIAAYLNRSITTVQRWEQEEGLPVHRLLHSKSGSVYALTHELDAWRSQRDSLPEAKAPRSSTAVRRAPPEFRRWHVAVLAAWCSSIVALGGLAAALGWPSAPPRITSVRTVVADLERFGGRLRSTEDCESPYANWSWTSDGERVYLAMPRVPGQGPAGSYALYQVPIAGGEPTEVPLPFEYEVRLLDYVPEESALLVRGTSEAAPLGTGQAGMPLWLVSTIDGTTRRIPNVVGNWADVAPDGRTLALIRLREKDPPRLILARLDGSRDTDLGPIPTDIFRPRWAPDGTRLRFFRGGFGRTESQVSIWERGIQGGAPRSLWPGSRGDWTPDGRYFVYDREEPGSFRQDLYAQREARWNGFRSSEPARLTMGPLSYWTTRREPGWPAALRLRSPGERRVDAVRSGNEDIRAGARWGIDHVRRAFARRRVAGVGRGIRRARCGRAVPTEASASNSRRSRCRRICRGGRPTDARLSLPDGRPTIRDSPSIV